MNVAQRIASLRLKRERRGSRVRCLLLTDGTREQVAERLSILSFPWAAVDPERHYWLPQGLDHPAEAKLGETPGLLCAEHRKSVTDWWLATLKHANTPNWDIASTATIGGNEGLLLVEAKAHSSELKTEGKPIDGNAQNHERICEALRSAAEGLDRVLPGWGLSAASCYQLANRFAWTWKIASLGIPVVLIYLGFLGAAEMQDQGEPFPDATAWELAMKHHGRGIVPETAWGKTLVVGHIPMRPLIKSMHVAIPS